MAISRTLFSQFNLRFTANQLNFQTNLSLPLHLIKSLDHEGWVVGEAVTANKYYIANGSVGV